MRSFFPRFKPRTHLAQAAGGRELLHAWNETRHTSLATQLEAARTSATRRKGLLGRRELLPGEGLWILPCQAIHTAWMRFPIDVVYLNRKKKVVKIRTNIPAWRISVCLTAYSVLELPIGTIAETLTAPGDLISILHSHPGPDVIEPEDSVVDSATL